MSGDFRLNGRWELATGLATIGARGRIGDAPESSRYVRPARPSRSDGGASAVPPERNRRKVLAMAEATGVDPEKLIEIAAAGSGASTMLTLKGPAMLARNYTTLFKTEHMLKDVRLCLQEGEDAGVPFPAAGHARALLTAAMARGHADADYAALVEAVEGLAGRRV